MSAVGSIEAFVKDLEDLKLTLQESLQVFREARKKLSKIDPDENQFLFRRFVEIERQALREFEKNVKKMNRTIETRLKETFDSLTMVEDREALHKIRRGLKHLQNAYDLESPIIEAALEIFSVEKL